MDAFFGFLVFIGIIVALIVWRSFIAQRRSAHVQYQLFMDSAFQMGRDARKCDTRALPPEKVLKRADEAARSVLTDSDDIKQWKLSYVNGYNVGYRVLF